MFLFERKRDDVCIKSYITINRCYKYYTNNIVHKYYLNNVIFVKIIKWFSTFLPPLFINLYKKIGKRQLNKKSDESFSQRGLKHTYSLNLFHSNFIIY